MEMKQQKRKAGKYICCSDGKGRRCKQQQNDINNNKEEENSTCILTSMRPDRLVNTDPIPPHLFLDFDMNLEFKCLPENPRIYAGSRTFKNIQGFVNTLDILESS